MLSEDQRPPHKPNHPQVPPSPQEETVSMLKASTAPRSLELLGVSGENFRDLLRQRPEASQALFSQYYEAFALAFPIEAERPTYERLLQKLTDPKSPLQILCFQRGNEIVGGRQFKVLRFDELPFAVGEFTWVTPEARKLGVGRLIIEATEQYVRSRGASLFVGEFHDPHLCTLTDRTEDAKAGVTPEGRLVFWAKQGYQALDAPYMVPPVHGQREWVRNCLVGVKRLHSSDTPLLLSADTYLGMLHAYWDSFSSGYREHPEYSSFIREVSTLRQIPAIPLGQRRSHLNSPID